MEEYGSARRSEEILRLRRLLALRAMAASGLSQRQIAAHLGLTQSAVSQQLKSAPDTRAVHPEILLQATAPVLKELAANHGYTKLAIFGSVARGEARLNSGIDLLVEAPEGTSSFGFMQFKSVLELTLGRAIDLAPYAALTSPASSDIGHEAVMLWEAEALSGAVEPVSRPVIFGDLAGQIHISDDFDSGSVFDSAD
ncbi:MAG: nucleotidyltransferase domain-containing protein [Kocuria sp.]|nr:nucleotidyltransferase domain-containing protein [Kocuria sp.]MDO5618063.1 nucleotidyltransferase domain-containing protein [Kocuria sp.]